MSLKIPQICLKDEKKFEGMMDQYCDNGHASQQSEVANSNYGLFNFVSDEESMDKRKYRESAQCPWHYTDTMECLLIRNIYQQALENRSQPFSPTAPIQPITNVPRITL